MTINNYIVLSTLKGRVIDSIVVSDDTLFKMRQLLRQYVRTELIYKVSSDDCWNEISYEEVEMKINKLK